MEVPQEMKMTPYLKEALIDNNHLTIKGQEFQEEVEQVDHLMEILMTMGHLHTRKPTSSTSGTRYNWVRKDFLGNGWCCRETGSATT